MIIMGTAKRMTAALLALLLCFSSAACGKTTPSSGHADANTAPVEPDGEESPRTYPAPEISYTFAAPGTVTLTWTSSEELYYEVAYLDDFTGKRHVLALLEPGDTPSFTDARSEHFSGIYTVTPYVSLEAKAAEDNAAAAGELPLRNGLINTDGYLYYYVNCEPAKNAEINGLSFDENGRYSCGDEELDEMIAERICTYTTPDMAPVDRLYALYVHIMDKEFFNYGAEPHVFPGTEGWETEYTKKFLQTGLGSCYSYAALTMLFARALGLESSTAIGDCYQHINWVWHCWTTVILDGETYICDAEMEGIFAPNHGANWDLFMVPIDDTPIVYVPHEQASARES